MGKPTLAPVAFLPHSKLLAANHHIPAIISMRRTRTSARVLPSETADQSEGR